VNVLLWHVHGSWTTAFVQGGHRYLLPVLPDRGPDGRGRARTWCWPDSVEEVTPAELRDAAVDVVIVQRPHELTRLVPEWLGRRPGRDVPAVYLEHNTPPGAVTEMRHPVADRRDLLLVHVTHCNRLFWDAGTTGTRVIEHGIVDPGARYTGELARAVAVVNEPARRGRVAGTDLLVDVRARVAVDLFGMGAEAVGGAPDLVQDRLHDEMGRRRVYFHPYRWTSLGLALVEALHLGMPVVSLATTEAAEVVPKAGGVATNDVDGLVCSLRALCADRDVAGEVGRRGRAYALERFGIGRFLADWDAVLEEVAS
jgi:hypothetical protein